MAEIEESHQQEAPSQAENLTQKLDKMNISGSFSIWPPSPSTRDAVINRLIETLTKPSVLSKRYGSMPPEEADSAARAIELAAFEASGGSSVGSASIDDGIEILQSYSKEISKRMLDVVKSRAASATPDVSSVKSADEPPAEATADVTSVEVSSGEIESSN